MFLFWCIFQYQIQKRVKICRVSRIQWVNIATIFTIGSYFTPYISSITFTWMGPITVLFVIVNWTTYMCRYSVSTIWIFNSLSHRTFWRLKMNLHRRFKVCHYFHQKRCFHWVTRPRKNAANSSKNICSKVLYYLSIQHLHSCLKICLHFQVSQEPFISSSLTFTSFFLNAQKVISLHK